MLTVSHTACKKPAKKQERNRMLEERIDNMQQLKDAWGHNKDLNIVHVLYW